MNWAMREKYNKKRLKLERPSGWGDFFFTASIIAFLACLWYCLASLNETINSSFQTNNSTNATLNYTKICGNKTLEEIAVAVANNHTYSNNYARQYNCWDFSSDLKQELIKAGYDAYDVAVLYDSTCSKDFRLSNALSHAWVIVKINGTSIPIEATTGEIISPEKYSDCYKYGYIQTDKFNSHKDEFLVK